ncbi:hypothetical protein L554_3500 [Bordetella pertussis I176]|nr:hypothetical protein L554_3500 [Bordetella pertussis I176]CPM26831.1 Uncharacterised protein [Bordetella pertussis]
MRIAEPVPPPELDHVQRRFAPALPVLGRLHTDLVEQRIALVRAARGEIGAAIGRGDDGVRHADVGVALRAQRARPAGLHIHHAQAFPHAQRHRAAQPFGQFAHRRAHDLPQRDVGQQRIGQREHGIAQLELAGNRVDLEIAQFDQRVGVARHRRLGQPRQLGQLAVAQDRRLRREASEQLQAMGQRAGELPVPRWATCFRRAHSCLLCRPGCFACQNSVQHSKVCLPF